MKGWLNYAAMLQTFSELYNFVWYTWSILLNDSCSFDYIAVLLEASESQILAYILLCGVRARLHQARPELSTTEGKSDLELPDIATTGAEPGDFFRVPD